jgi:hypothetical protein
MDLASRLYEKGKNGENGEALPTPFQEFDFRQ